MFKIILVGAQGVGKTSIITRFMEGDFNDDYFSTIGIDFKLHNLTLAHNKIKLQIWDTAGQERFQSLTSIHFKGANGCVCVLDLTSGESLKNCRYYLNEAIKQYGINPLTVFLVGNKVDSLEKRLVSQEEIDTLAEEFGVSTMNCSAKNGQSINKLFEDLAARLMEYSEEQPTSFQTRNPRIEFVA